MLEDGTRVEFDKWDHTIDLILNCSAPFPCQGPITAANINDWGPFLLLLQQCGISMVEYTWRPANQQISDSPLMMNICSRVVPPPPNIHVWTDCCEPNAHAINYYYANVPSWRTGCPKGRQRNGQYQRAILKMAQYGIMVAPHGNKGTMVNRGARVTLPGDSIGSSCGLGMVSGSATERVTAKWN